MAEEKMEMPIFIKVEEYKDIVDILDLIKSKLGEAKGTLGKINQLKNEEDSELEVWRSEIDEVERKINFIDKAMFQPHPV